MTRGGVFQVLLIIAAAFAVVVDSSMLAGAAILDHLDQVCKPLPKTAPLDSLTSFAALAVAIAISYAGLPNFRHRLRVEEYIQKKVQDKNLLAMLVDSTGKPNPIGAI
jgi:hypothetical protein